MPQEKRRRKNAQAPIHNAINNDAKAGLALAQLEAHLWESANILRGPVDAADFKTYIFPLLFFKRISDANDEEYQAALAESGGDEEYAHFPQNYRFQIPEGCHWRDVRTVAKNVGQALQTALRGIEKANPETLYGIFGDAQWTNKDRLSDALLRDLIEHFSRISLGNEAADADVLGQSYEYLIKKFADLTNKKAGEFYTPRSVVRLMVNILDPHQGETIYDPACGTGGMLLEAIHHVRERHEDARTLWGKIFGQEKNLTTSAIARMNLFLHGAADFQIVRGDTLRNPAFFLGDGLARLGIEHQGHQVDDGAVGIELSCGVPAIVGELLDQVLVGAAQLVLGQVRNGQFQRGEMLHQIAQHGVGQAILVGPLRVAENAV